MLEGETVSDEPQRARDMAGLSLNRGPNHVPDRGLDQKIINVVGLYRGHVRDHNPVPEKGGTTMHYTVHLHPPDTGGS